MNPKESQIKKQAKQILDKFAKALAKVDRMETKVSLTSHPSLKGVDREEFERKESDGKECEKGFKKRFLKNAPEHDDDFIIAERGKWK